MIRNDSILLTDTLDGWIDGMMDNYSTVGPYPFILPAFILLSFISSCFSLLVLACYSFLIFHSVVAITFI